MGVSVEDREGADERDGRPEWRTRREDHHQAEHDAGQRDAGLDAGQRHAGDAGGAAERHDQREDHRQQPDGGGAQDAAPKTDGDHRHHVVGPGDRVQQAAGEPAEHAAGMGKRGAGADEQRHDEQGWARWGHGNAFLAGPRPGCGRVRTAG